ncbi:GNAT family N-acetyltransferase [Pseudomonas sp. SIMBA_077]
MQVSLRVAHFDDIDSIFDIRTRVKENHLSREQLAEMGITPDAIREALVQAPCVWIAEIDGICAGFSMADLQDGCVFAAFVLPEYEGLGLGRQLMDKAQTFLFERHPTIWLETAEASRAYGFYRALGWTPVERLPEGDIRFEKSRIADPNARRSIE